MNASIESIRADVARLLSRNRIRKFRIINDLTQESFTVEGPSIYVCRLIADRECARLGWDKNKVFSEVIDE